MGANLSFVRVGFNYFFSDAVVDYIVEAVHLVANEGWKLLPNYRFDPDSGMWHHATGTTPRRCRFGMSRLPGRGRSDRGSSPRSPRPCCPGTWTRREASSGPRAAAPSDGPDLDPPLPPDFERIRWFPLPSEARAELLAESGRSIATAESGV